MWSATTYQHLHNNIPVITCKNKSYSLLFADDVVTFFIFKNPGHVNTLVPKYMLTMENWLNKWRLSMHPKKCNQMIFNVNSNKKINKSLPQKLFGETIPSCESLKFLGLTFDLVLNSNEHVKQTKKKCISRLNILKVISNRKYKLNKRNTHYNLFSTDNLNS